MNAQSSTSVLPEVSAFLVESPLLAVIGGLVGGVLSVGTLFDYWRSLSVVRPL